MRLEDVLLSADKVDGLLAKVVTKNEDSGRHGVVVPVGAYSLFPSIPDFVPGAAVNHTVRITTVWRTDLGARLHTSSYKHYHRYPERRITALGSPDLDRGGPGTLIVIARRTDGVNRFEVHVFPPGHPQREPVLAALGFSDATPGMYVLEREWSPARPAAPTGAVEELLVLFDALAKLGKVPTLRAGPTGVGYTLEHHMGIAENNSSLADFKGVELKSIRSSEFRPDSPERTNLFLKEPTWTDGLGSVERVEEYGYVDEDGRNALYSCVAGTKNSHGFRLRVDENRQRLCIDRDGVEVGYYKREVLEKRLKEKLNELLVVLADSSGKGDRETFAYHSVIHCAYPSVDALLRLVDEGHVFIELRMHVRTDGTHRNHGTGFRVRMSKWPDLFGVVRALRGPGTK